MDTSQAPWLERADEERNAMAQLILIIDDSETVRKIFEVCLHRAGYEDVRSFPDGTEMLRWLLMPEARIPSLVFVDLNLPKMDGYTLIRHLKAKPAFAHTVFVILTGRNGMLDKLKGRVLGAHIYFTKPFRTQEITAAVTAHLGAIPVPEPGKDENRRDKMPAVSENRQGDVCYAGYL